MDTRTVIVKKANRLDKALELYERALTLDPKPDQADRLKNKIKELKNKK